MKNDSYIDMLINEMAIPYRLSAVTHFQCSRWSKIGRGAVFCYTKDYICIECGVTIMNQKEEVIEALQYSRHDWLNRLQLIKGNIALKRIDRVEQLIEEITNQMRTESVLTSLSAVELTHLLLTYNWSAKRFQLQYELDIDPQRVVIDDAFITTLLKRLFLKLNEHCNECSDNLLHVELIGLDQQLQMNFTLTGRIEKSDELLDFLTVDEQYSHNAIIQILNENELIMKIIV